MDIAQKIIDDLIKGAAASEGFVRGSRMQVQIGEAQGHETKLASIGGALGGGVLGGGAGALGGGLAGAGTGALLGKLLHLDPSLAQELGTMLGMGGAAAGGIGGAAAGAAAGQEPHHPSLMERIKGGGLDERYTKGAKAAATRFGIKEAFLGSLLPLAGSALGGMGLRAGAGALAKGAGGKMLGGLASKALPHMAGGIGGAATDAIGGSLGGMLGQRLSPQRQPQPGMA